MLFVVDGVVARRLKYPVAYDSKDFADPEGGDAPGGGTCSEGAEV